MEFSKKLKINEFSKVHGKKSIYKNQMCFYAPAMNNSKIKKVIPFIVPSKRKSENKFDK